MYKVSEYIFIYYTVALLLEQMPFGLWLIVSKMRKEVKGPWDIDLFVILRTNVFLLYVPLTGQATKM